MDYTRLELLFETVGGSTSTISIYDPKEDLTDTEVKTAMENLLANNIFTTSKGDFKDIKSARIVTRDVKELDVL